MHIDFIDRVDEAFESAFREIVAFSTEEHEIVLIGVPAAQGDSFVVRGSRYRRSVLIEDRNTSNWIPALVCITWRRSQRGSQPLLQVNTPKNSTREMGKASHVSGYINKRDLPLPQLTTQNTDLDFLVPPETIANALKRELFDDFGIESYPSNLQTIGTQPFYYTDKENLFFYIVQQELSASHLFEEGARMFPWTVQELIATRRYHVLDNAMKALPQHFTTQQRLRARELIRANLIAQGDAGLAAEVDGALSNAEWNSTLIGRLEAIKSEIQVCKYSGGRELAVDGLAGLQYRIFFSHLLPSYAAIGVAGADEELSQIGDDTARLQAVSSLAELYGNEDFITSLPMEL